ncbi:uncharacterized protein LOC103931154 [Pyrus x bretschneideri]|uniref:uncharacterized protein LOC103931154 n=1 Tax=Pyrus x bretschneideri TaxID=225117 RepID=UPI00202FDBD7|nr:uncharacterized protein LOC103931154 [Pyrus x bretschneideri]
MAVTMIKMGLIVAVLGIVSFAFGIAAEVHKPAAGIPIIGRNGVVMCKYPSDPTVVYGYLSFAFLVASSLTGFLSVFYPYKGKSVPSSAFLQSTLLVTFFNSTLGAIGLAAALLLWPTISGQQHHNMYQNLSSASGCPTAKTGVLGGGAFLSLNSSLLWLVCLMLTSNARYDFLDDLSGESKAKEATTSGYKAALEKGLDNIFDGVA